MDEIGIGPSINLRTDEQDDKMNNTVFCIIMPCILRGLDVSEEYNSIVSSLPDSGFLLSLTLLP
jgi:hypothetical protein